MGVLSLARLSALAFTLFTLLFLLSDVVQATTVTTIIDDADENIIYSGGNWVMRSPTQGCDGCAGREIDQSQSYESTWHEISDVGQAEFTFFGTGIKIFCTIRNMLDNQSNYSFYIDNQIAGNYIYKGIGGNVWLYNTSVFTRTGLAHGEEHTMRIVDGTTSFMAFDYAVVTDETPDPPPSSSASSVSSVSSTSSVAALSSSPTTASSSSTILPSTGSDVSPTTSLVNPPGNTQVPAAAPPTYLIIVGAATGGAALIGLCVLIWWLLRRRRRRLAAHSRSSSPTQSDTRPRPYVQVRRGLRSDLDIAGSDEWDKSASSSHPPYAAAWAVSSSSLIRNPTAATQKTTATRGSSFYESKQIPVPNLPYPLPNNQHPWSTPDLIPLQSIPRGKVYSPPAPPLPAQAVTPSRHRHHPASVSSSSNTASTTKSRQHLYGGGGPQATQVIVHEDGGRQLQVGEPTAVEELPPMYASYNSTYQILSTYHGQ